MNTSTHIRTQDVQCVGMNNRTFSHQPQPLIFNNSQGHRFKLASIVVKQLRTYAQIDKHIHEAGGILLGRYLLDTNDVMVDQITVPAKSDKRNRRSFIRETAFHQEAVDQVWKASNGTCHYLGEWHTHPEQKPAPSPIDTANWNRLLIHYQEDPDPLYFIIVGTKDISAWQGHKKPIRLERLRVITSVEETI